jgi:hypothetical protein
VNPDLHGSLSVLKLSNSNGLRMFTWAL